jgi:hypothetical protein
MATKQQDKQHAEKDKQERQIQGEALGKKVMHTLGQPTNLQRVQVRQLWDDHYRVNIFAGDDLASAKVVQSFFLLADGAGNILQSTPAIKKQY